MTGLKREVFSLKAFDKVWHKGIIFKLKQIGISGKLLSVLSDFLKGKKHRVTLKGQVPPRTSVTRGVPQGLILGPLIFWVNINDLADGPLIKYNIVCR